jgi:hypothetical protein
MGPRLRIDDAQDDAAIADGESRVVRCDATRFEDDGIVVDTADRRIPSANQDVIMFPGGKG